MGLAMQVVWGLVPHGVKGGQVQKKIKLGGSRKSQASQESLLQSGLIAPATKKTQKQKSSETLAIKGNSASLTTKIAPKVKMSQH